MLFILPIGYNNVIIILLSYFRGGRRSPKTPPWIINLFARWRGRSFTRIIRGNNEPSQPVSHLCQKAELISLLPRCTRVTVHGGWDGGAGGGEILLMTAACL